MTAADLAHATRLVHEKAHDPAWVAAFARKLGIDPALISHVELNVEEDSLRATGRNTAEIEFDVAAISGEVAHCISAVASVELAERQAKITLLRFIELD